MSIILDGSTGITTPADTVTTINSPAATALTIQSAGTTAMTVDTSQKVGIGTTSPTAKLHVSGTGTAARIISESTGTANSNSPSFYFLRSSTTSAAADFQGAFVWQRTLTDSTSITSSIQSLGSNVAGSPAMNLTYNAYTSHQFQINGTDAARIDSSSNLLVGTTSPNVSASRRGISVLAPTGSYVAASFANDGGASAQTGEFWNKATSSNNAFVTFATEATYTERGTISYQRSSGLVAYGTTSDYRAKDILGPVENSGTVIDALKVYRGKMKGATIERPMFIAHEAQEAAPYAVIGEKDAVNDDDSPVFQQMDVSSFVPLLVAEIQSLRARLAALEAK
jgi:hypothetical protein